jgi:2-dehydropantoate 2-reductase
VPWWYFERLDSPLKGRRLEAVDPGGTLAATLPVERVIGGMYFKPSHVVAPGHIRLADSAQDALTIGELDNRRSERLERIAELIAPAGWPVRITTDIRAAKWRKLLSNAVWNPLSAITQGTAQALASSPATAAVAETMIAEVIAVAASVGVALDADPRSLVALDARRVPIPSSTLQDVRAGRALEIDALVKAVLEIAQLTGVPTPVLGVVGACAQFVNQRIVEDRVAIAPRPLDGSTLR